MADTQLPDPTTKTKDVLLQTDEHFRQLVTEHHELDERLRHLSSLGYISNQQHYEEIALKKRKLALKDRIEAMVRQARSH